MKKKNLDFRFQAPYFIEGSISEKTEKIWIIFHGYGQLGDEFAQEFAPCATDENVLIFPQGLSKFYLKGVTNKVGANWMTANDRKLDVDNYIAYLDHMYDREVRPFVDKIKLNILGFSQGGHTATRWIYTSEIPYSKLVLWGSNLAHEIDKKVIAKSFSLGENILICGDSDKYIDADRLKKLHVKYEKMGFTYQFVQYQGGHSIYPEILKTFV